MTQPRITGLWIYPIKSCRGISVKELEIGPTGPIHDRQWMIVDAKNEFITLRTEPKLSQIITDIQKEALIIRFASSEFYINFKKESDDQELVHVWKSRVFAGVESAQINNSLSKFLGYPAKLVRYQSDSARPLGVAATKVTANVMFADSKPLLLVNEESLQDLNLKLEMAGLPKSEIERFRANVIINGLPAFTEDQGLTFMTDNVQLTHPSLCSRCPIVTQDVQSGEVASKETLTTLASYRRISGSKVMFGVYWTPSTLGKIQVGEKVKFNFPKSSST